ncbi:ABC transporter substrate-binding protein [Amycolatopsis jejuensis]|uniref:ABC transporter substrate-binding protein n=1 Tax=Amycolatopsis jejuensis TaxID=330084 RepID=UPI0006924365|nr:ABC transporter substrate-binding protein [Amycolatopsis jejuensis]
MKTRRLAGVVAAGALVAGAAAGCGSGSSAAKDEIVIGNIGTYSGALSSSLGPARGVIEAWAAGVNKAGGINGRTVKLVVKDDGGNATTALTAARELISKDKVVAIVGQISVNADTWAPVAAQAGVPVIGGMTSSSSMMTDPNFFPIGTNNVAQTYGKVATAAKLGKKMGDLYCAEAPVCATAAGTYRNYAPVVGIEVPVIQKILASAPNYTAPCQAIKDAGVQSYMIDQAAQVAVRVADECAAQGVKAKVIGSAGTVSTEWLKHPSVDGTLSVETAFPFFDTSTPATKAYQQLLKDNGLGDAGGGNGTYAYLGGKLFTAAVEQIGSAAVTKESVKKGLYALKGETLGGLVPSPLTFTEGKPTHLNCWFTIAIRGGAFVTPEGLKTNCAPADLVEAAIAKLR